MVALFSAACASAARAPAPDLLQRVQAARSFSGRLRLSLKGPELRGRAGVLLGFERPDALRVEIPGATGARLIAVTRDGRVAAAFPGDRAFFEGAATPDALEALLGVGLAPSEVMDLLAGTASPRLRGYQARWGPLGPRVIEATLPDGARLKVTVEDAEYAVSLPPEAFADPPHAGFRTVDAAEARSLWSSPSRRGASR